MDRYDAVVIGSGPNGLTAAITLAEQGRSVLVLEAAPHLGGAVATEALTLPGFRHDTYSAVYPAAAASPVFVRMPLTKYGLRWVQPPIAMAHPFRDGQAVALFRDLDRTVDNLDRLTPGDGQAWRAFITPYLTAQKAVRSTIFAAFPPLSGAMGLLTGLGVGGALAFARMACSSAESFATARFRDMYVRAWLFGTAMHADVPPWRAGSALAAFYLLFLGHLVGWPSPEGGAANLTNALVAYLTALGGQTRTSTAVARIVVSGRCVVGVVTANNARIHAPVIIADVTPRGLIQLAGDALPSSYVARMARYRYGPATFKVDWALDGPVPWTAPEARLAGTVHVGGLATDLTDALRQQEAGTVPERPFLLFGQQSLADPSRAPAGKQTAWAYTHVPHGIDWTMEAARTVERIEAQVERFAPGFRDSILARHIITPPEFAARNANLIDGDVGGGSTALGQLLFRPVPSLSPYRTPMHGLYIGSASTFPGPGVHGIPGDAAAHCALRDTHVRRG